MTLFPPLNYLYFFGFLLALAFLDFNLIHWAVLQIKRLDLAVEKFLFMLKLRFEIWQIRNGFQDKKFERMADELLNELRPNETDRT